MEVSLAVKDLDPLGLCSIVPLWNFVPKTLIRMVFWGLIP